MPTLWWWWRHKSQAQRWQGLDPQISDSEGRFAQTLSEENQFSFEKLQTTYFARVIETKPVGEGEGVVEDQVQQEVLPDQLVDAALPFEE